MSGLVRAAGGLPRLGALTVDYDCALGATEDGFLLLQLALAGVQRGNITVHHRVPYAVGTDPTLTTVLEWSWTASGCAWAPHATPCSG